MGLKENTIKLYVKLIEVYLKSLNTDTPTSKDAKKFYDSLHDKKLSRSSINNYAASIIKYHQMIDAPVKLPFLRLNQSLPYYFNEIDILKIFNACNNIKHLCMFKVMFFGCLRSGELCRLDDEDYDPQNLTLRLKETKNGTDAIVYVNDEVSKLLNQYLKVRPKITVDERYPLFYTDFGNRWNNNQIHKIFLYYKKKAGIEKKGSVHCFSRHSSATLMIANGCDLATVQSILRHKDINTTLRYIKISDKTKREKYDKFLVL